MTLEEFKTHLLLMEWTVEHQSVIDGIWKKGVNAIVWTRDSSGPDKQFITHQTVGNRDSYLENRNRALDSFQACIAFLDEEKL